MGSGTSRGIKVAPVCVSEINVSNKDVGASSLQESNSIKPLTPSNLNNVTNARNRGQLDCQSEGQSQDSEFSGEDDDIDLELERVLAEYDDDQGNVSINNSAKTSSARYKTYGLGNFSHTGKQIHSAATKDLPRDRESGVSSHFKAPVRPSNQQITPSQDVTNHASVQPAPTQETESFVNCQIPSINMPVFQYDGSEEELMDTIEREFS